MTIPDLFALLLALGCGIALGVIGLAFIQAMARLESQDRSTEPWDMGK